MLDPANDIHIINSILFIIVDILFAFLYELRVFDCDLGEENAITINKLSSVLSCHTVDNNM